jgi:hypothetical protein
VASKFSASQFAATAQPLHALAVAANYIDPPGRRWTKDPVTWAQERGPVETWSAQRTIMESVRDNRQTAVQSCHEIGKSFTAALVSCWWIDSHPPGEAFVVTTAPSDKQVKAILWREINRLHSRLNLAGRTNLSEWYFGQEMVAYGRKPSDYDPTAFQGIHAKYMLVIIDEACGVPKALWDAASSLTANQYGRTLAIGNPDDPSTEFGAVCRDDGWNVIKIGYDKTPNFTGETISEHLSDLLIHPAWVAERRKKWGAESALFRSKCEGEFPEVGTDGVVPLAWAEACRWLELPAQGDRQGGIDVGAGADRTILRERVGMRAGRELEFVDSDPMRTVGRLAEAINDWGLTRVKVDVIGIGWGIYGRLRELSSVHNPLGECAHHAEVIPINVGEGPSPGEERRFLNKRAEIWWKVGRELSRLRAWDLSEVDDDTLGELCTPRYQILDSFGKIKIEAKAEVRKRLQGLSTDHADSLLLAYWDPVREAEFTGINTPDVDLMEGLGSSGFSVFD